jgi:hypothetical protein
MNKFEDGVFVTVLTVTVSIFLLSMTAFLAYTFGHSAGMDYQRKKMEAELAARGVAEYYIDNTQIYWRYKSENSTGP